MKKLIPIVFLLLSFTGLLVGQWTESSGNITTSNNSNVTINNNQYYQSFRSNGTTQHQAFGMDGNNDIIFNRSAVVGKQTSRLVFAFADRSIDFRDKNNVTHMSLRANGNVGIGTINPGSFKLAVEGNIGSREIQVTNAAPFPDYVFNENYNLLSIEELSKFIQENKHLPNIPSATDVEEAGGIMLGEMSIKLLEKIEELTLYIIDQEKRIKILEAKLK